MKYFLSVVIILALLGYASALSCYVCTNEGDKCADEKLVECDAQYAVAGMTFLLLLKPSIQVIPSTNYQCYTLVVEAETDKAVIKSCIYDTVQVCDGALVDSVEQTQCKVCMEDGCNGSSRIRPGFGAVISVITVAVTMIFGTKY